MQYACSIRTATRKLGSSVIALTLLATPVVLAGCNSTSEVISHGYQVDDNALALVPEGSAREQVLLTLGTPSTTVTQPDGTETLYYIGQKKQRSFAFAAPQVIDQRVLAVYLDDSSTVSRIANYGLQDGKVFDFVRRVTPTGGKDLTFIGQILSGSARPTLG